MWAKIKEFHLLAETQIKQSMKQLETQIAIINQMKTRQTLKQQHSDSLRRQCTLKQPTATAPGHAMHGAATPLNLPPPLIMDTDKGDANGNGNGNRNGNRNQNETRNPVANANAINNRRRGPISWTTSAASSASGSTASVHSPPSAAMSYGHSNTLPVQKSTTLSTPSLQCWSGNTVNGKGAAMMSPQSTVSNVQCSDLKAVGDAKDNGMSVDFKHLFSQFIPSQSQLNQLNVPSATSPSGSLPASMANDLQIDWNNLMMPTAPNPPSADAQSHGTNSTTTTTSSSAAAGTVRESGDGTMTKKQKRPKYFWRYSPGEVEMLQNHDRSKCTVADIVDLTKRMVAKYGRYRSAYAVAQKMNTMGLLKKGLLWKLQVHSS